MRKSKKIKSIHSREMINSEKKLFTNKQLRFSFSKVALILYPNISKDILIKGEEMIVNAKKNKTMFVKSFDLLKTKDKIDWVSFGLFMFYSFQTSTYWKDRKKGIENIFNSENYNEMNETKRELYYKWLFSITPELDKVNEKVRRVMKVVF